MRTTETRLSGATGGLPGRDLNFVRCPAARYTRDFSRAETAHS